MAIKKVKEKLADRKLGEEVEETLEGKALEKAAEEESLKTEIPEKNSEQAQVSPISLDERKKKLLEKAKKLSEKIDAVATTEELKEQVKAKKRTDMLVDLEEYVKAGIYLGTRVVTPEMKKYVYRRRADGLAIFNTDIIDEKLKEAINFLSQFNPNEIILVCKRQVGWKAAEKLGEITGIKVFTKKYPAGILTNTKLPDFFETELAIVTDSWLDRNAFNDTLKVGKKIMMICDTNNFPKGANQIIIGNNKAGKSLGLIFYLLSRGYCKAKGIEADIPDLEWWTTEEEPVLERHEKLHAEKGASKGV